MHQLRYGPRACALLAGLLVTLAAGPAGAGWSDALEDGWDATRNARQVLIERTQQAIVAGGVILYRHRHAVAGAALGCVAGSMAATTLAVGAGLATGGGALAGAAPAVALGCGVGALGGAALGRPLDDVYDPR